MLLYTVARPAGQKLEFYFRPRHSDAIAWTDAEGDAWAAPYEGWAEKVRAELMRRGHLDVFVHPIAIISKGEVSDE